MPTSDLTSLVVDRAPTFGFPTSRKLSTKPPFAELLGGLDSLDQKRTLPCWFRARSRLASRRLPSCRPSLESSSKARPSSPCTGSL